MFQRIVVPVDDSDRSWGAARVGATIAAACDADLELVSIAEEHGDVGGIRHDLERGVEQEGRWPVTPSVAVEPLRPSDASIGAAIARHCEERDGSMLVMSSTGRNRSAAVLGSVADEVLRTMFGPIIVVGPHVASTWTPSGAIVVPVDGSAFSEMSLPLAAAWGIAWDATPWIVEVLTEAIPPDADVAETAYTHRLANDLARTSHHDVEFEVLHGPAPHQAIADFADDIGARFVMLSTHGRSGVERFALGSVAAGVVHRAKCPVVLHRPPRFALDAPM